MGEGKIDNPRSEIDAIDEELLRLLNKRAEIALRVGAAKTNVETSLCDPTRELEVLARMRAENPGPFAEHNIDSIFQRIIVSAMRWRAAMVLTGELFFVNRFNATSKVRPSSPSAIAAIVFLALASIR